MAGGWLVGWLAEGRGFEPRRRLPAYTLSRRAPSSARASLRGRLYGVPTRAFERTEARSDVDSSRRARRVWDLNPGRTFTLTRFRVVRLRPLGHPAGVSLS